MILLFRDKAHHQKLPSVSLLHRVLPYILIQDRLLIWEQIPEALKDEVLGELEFDTRQQLIESIDVIRDIRFYPRP